MAQTKRKRRTKHRGNAAGVVENRGRTSRPPSPEARKQQRKDQARSQRNARFDRPPSWKAAANRAAITTLLFIVVIVAILRQPLPQAIALGAFMLLLYIPFGYYTDSFFYKRRRQTLEKKRQGGR
jgi:hypothetical protein